MARYAGRGRDQRALDIVSAEIIYANGQESYRNVKIDYRPVHNYTMSNDIKYIEPKARVY